MASLQEIVAFLDAELRISEIPDYSGAVNGLQLENGGTVTKVAAAVDASLPVVEAAVAAGADLLVVHHGMFWQGTQPLTRAFYRKIKAAMDGGLAIYSAHLPLDVHPELGNNALMLRALGFEPQGTFFDWKGTRLGLVAEVEISRDSLIAKVSEVVSGPVHVCPGGPSEIMRMIELFAGRASLAIGIDRSSEMLRLARVKLEAAGISSSLRQGDMYALPLADDSADSIIIHQVLHYAHSPAAAIAEAARVLAPDGTLLVVDFAAHDREELRASDAHIRLGFDDKAMAGWFAAAGVEVNRVEHLKGGELTVTLWRGSKSDLPQRRAA